MKIFLLCLVVLLIAIGCTKTTIADYHHPFSGNYLLYREVDTSFVLGSTGHYSEVDIKTATGDTTYLFNTSTNTLQSTQITHSYFFADILAFLSDSQAVISSQVATTYRFSYDFHTGIINSNPSTYIVSQDNYDNTLRYVSHTGQLGVVRYFKKS